ncbi:MULTISPECIES: DHA2 family efflux MFS transporter permease subunit [Heyndrickxia]|uniref:DHA2 family efflux MFS transporter permease subunit n=1 Tax=Heyndrickxia sporothermodurans TaxID=46224 RepID=A0AB37HEB2_9BACI|nr:DHA2 family efflux MFS transporter permease subunit [Heyndrickxia sporothermodurans]MBL5771054.1 DHA2 family efflux MFS transporter permease subunit [Heyndrickxia sporothermodurans]MBL5774723.1 DHA2 family efflux MFS transporter permease subunit [Heyndrickxia sporothermodurans]MBL5778181.1 DHA2 family efflux MFS transporter permease subunit [Heyndrickxia sporothermodurans]MBL5785428.1 DHA2 family efflux MFS transporter permease subunit [Heyndrickxia sporothermodurans]MBL5788915.1 DHA2 famil
MEQSIKTTKRPPYGIIAVLMVGAFIAFLNNTLLNIALPSIMKDLEVGPSTVQWLATGFMLVNGVLIPTTAFLIQKYSVRRLFLIAMGLFTVGTILAGFAHVFGLLLAGRMIQASGSAIMMPLLMNVMLVSFPVEKRGAAMGFFGLIMMGAPAIGPTLSGWLVEQFDWRMLFHFITPIAIVVFLLGLFLLKDKKDKVNIRLDMLSVLLSSLGFGGILYGFSSAGSKGWDSPQVYGTLIVGVLSLAWFIIRQLYQEKPMLNFRIYKYPMYALSSVISMVITMAMFSAMMLLPIYVQTLRGISPLDAGLLLLPGAILMALMSPITGKLFDKIGGRILAIIGLTITIVTTYFFSKLSFDTTYTHLIILYSLRMFGMSMVMMPVSTNGLNQLPARFYPHGTAMNSTLQQVSGAIGTALLVTIMSNRTESTAKELAADAMKHLTGQPTEAAMAAMKQQIEMKAMLEGINFSFLVTVFIAAVALVLSFFIKRAKQAEDPLVGTGSNEKLETKLAGN